MNPISRRDPGLLVKVGVALSLFHSWVLFEELVVDRLGWWRYMPCYVVGRFCEWDAGAILAILLVSILGYPESRARAGSFVRRVCAPLGCPFCHAA